MIQKAAELIRSAQNLTAFTGAGISVESGIPPFRGENGLWNRYDPQFLDIQYFQYHSGQSWPIIKEIFYDHFGDAHPNGAHEVLAAWEQSGLLKSIITQNIDNLHQRAGSKEVYEFHGNSRNLVCMECGKNFAVEEVSLEELPVQCTNCGGLVKPSFIFFGEGIPPLAYKQSVHALEQADVLLVIGTTGEVVPAGQLPYIAKEHGAAVIEINTEPSVFTKRITDVFLQGKASDVLRQLATELDKINTH
ncbi:MAG: NAD-dependent deacylase [Bacteroidales bacterium]|nr:NAD-dependent deacylase [Bacteroidales bacterium]